MVKKSPKSNRNKFKKFIVNPYTLLTIFILIGSFLRLIYLDLTIMGTDVVKTLMITDRILSGDIFLGGIPENLDINSRITTLGPLVFYFLLIPRFFSSNIIYSVGLIAILNILSIFLLFKFAKDFFGIKIGLIAAGLLAVNPWSIFYSRFIWNPNFLIFFAIIFYYLLFSYIIKNNEKAIIFMLPLIVLMLHFNLLAASLIVLLIVVWTLFKRRLNLKYLTIGIISSIVLILPIIFHILQNSSFTRVAIEFLTYTRDTSVSASNFIVNFVQAMGIPIMFTTNFYGSNILGTTTIFQNPMINFYFFILIAFTVILFLLSLIYNLKEIKNNKDKAKILLLLSLVIPIILLILGNANIALHYLIITIPISIIIMATFFNFLFRKFKYKDYVVTLILLILIVSQFTYALSFILILKKEGGTNGSFGITYKNSEDLVNFIIDQKEFQETKDVYVYKTIKPTIKWIFDQKDFEVNYIVINSIEEINGIKKGYLILDRFTTQGTQGRIHLSEEENKYFDSIQLIKIKRYELIKLPIENV